jgi:hypothetical protein
MRRLRYGFGLGDERFSTELSRSAISTVRSEVARFSKSTEQSG